MDTYGPPLPPGFKLPSTDSESEDEQPKKKLKVIGPQIPTFLTQKQTEDNGSSSEDEPQTPSIIGPIFPGKSNDNFHVDDNEVYGPLPPLTKVDYDVVNIIEKRAASMKDKLDNKDVQVTNNHQREEWMVVPDTSRRNQLGAISRCLAPGSKEPRKETDSHHNPESDKKTTEELKKYTKSKRGESLLDMHTKKKKKKDKKEKKSKREERKAFDRDEIAVRLFNKEQVNSVIDKAKIFNSRFKPGRSQYL